ncbi:hypothetical protein [Natronobacterium texcoconense]|uniref:DUF8152 domain-containing protein n=1 Tax=Natronobacterium texcoconense TaxID=1095778 RepID=A0A1H1CHX6_NATTX|nr:hypothetical protein [Natronobacterium texcoconense]SDQ63738.1 hypothetical protein SAMN04489842_1411 [Natronobacterium texcoconense]
MTWVPAELAFVTADESVRDHVSALATHLEKTAEFPLERTTSRYLGEAEAVARDAATADLERDVVRTRVETVQELLGELEPIEHDEGRSHVEAARHHCEAVLEERP